MQTYRLGRVLGLPRVWWDKLLFAWCATDKSHLGFFVMLLLPFVVLGALVRFAHADRIERNAAQHRAAELRCLADNIFHEARGEPLAGQHAVAEVTLNRVASARFPDTVCGVVHEKRLDVLRRRYVGAFSWTELDSRHPARGPAWQRALEVARAAYDRTEPSRVPGALYYHAERIEPSWAADKQRIAKIGNHIFYP